MRDRVLHRGSPQPYPRPIDGDPGLTPAGCLLAIALAAAFWILGITGLWWACRRGAPPNGGLPALHSAEG